MSPSRQIAGQHQRAIDRLAEAYKDDNRFVALIIGGSVAKGYARPDSDVDFMIVATDGEFARRDAANDLFINRRDLCDYDGGFVDGKVIDLAYLRDVAGFGNEPSRAAFQGAFTAFCHQRAGRGPAAHDSCLPRAGSRPADQSVLLDGVHPELADG